MISENGKKSFWSTGGKKKINHVRVFATETDFYQKIRAFKYIIILMRYTTDRVQQCFRPRRYVLHFPFP